MAGGRIFIYFFANPNRNIYIGVCVHIHMAVKNISIMEDAYRLLLARKQYNESFSDVIRKTMKNKRSIMDLAGAWKNVSNEDSKKIKSEIALLRKRSTREIINL